MTTWQSYGPCTLCGAPAGTPCGDTRMSPRAPYVEPIARPHRGRINMRIWRSRKAFAQRPRTGRWGR